MPEIAVCWRTFCHSPIACERHGVVSFGLDTRSLDDRPPFLDLGLLKGAQRFRRALLARVNFQPMSASRLRTVGSAKAFTTRLC